MKVQRAQKGPSSFCAKEPAPMALDSPMGEIKKGRFLK